LADSVPAPGVKLFEPTLNVRLWSLSTTPEVRVGWEMPMPRFDMSETMLLATIPLHEAPRSSAR
jgi:hypothetical protein